MEPVDFSAQKARLEEARRLADDLPELSAVLGYIAEETRRIERQVKRNRLDVTSYMEMARQVNSRGLDFERIEAYVRNLVRGRLFTTSVHLLREGPEADGTICEASAPAGDERLRLPARGPLAEWLVKVQTAFGVASRTAELERLGVLGALQKAQAQVLVPLVRADQTRLDLKGVLVLGPKLTKQPYADADLEFLGFLAELIAIALHNAYLYYRSTHDALTRVYTRGYLDVVLASEISRARRALERPSANHPGLAVLMIDIDHFKQVNDGLGHQVGDRVLRAVAETMAGGLRDYDTLARYGGEEFVALLPDTPKKNAIEVAERLRARVEKLDSPFGAERPITVSLGVAGFPDDGASVQEVLARADQSLYLSKQRGRNQVTVA